MARIRGSSARGLPASRTERTRQVRHLSARRRVHGPAGDPARWMVSYADFMTLLLAFFVLLYAHRALTATPEHPDGALGPLEAAVGSALGLADVQASGTTGASSRVPVDSRLLELSRKLETMAGSEAPVDIEYAGDVVELNIASSALFPSASAQVDYDALPLLGEVARIIAAAAVDVTVVGHTDSQPIRTARFPSNWELSAARAAGVARLLLAHGVRGERVVVAARAQYQPRTTDATVDGRAANRRVVVRLRVPRRP